MLTGRGALTSTQVHTCKAILNVFETSSVVGRYGSVTVLAGDTGQLSFGRSQSALGSGNLALLIERYVANAAARFGARLVHLGLSERSLDVRADGIFGSGSRDAMASFQRRSGLPVTGMLDVVTVAELAAG